MLLNVTVAEQLINDELSKTPPKAYQNACKKKGETRAKLDRSEFEKNCAAQTFEMFALLIPLQSLEKIAPGPFAKLRAY